jgi:hypothetical protein
VPPGCGGATLPAIGMVRILAVKRQFMAPNFDFIKAKVLSFTRRTDEKIVAMQ